MLFAQAPEGDLAGIRWGVEACFSTVDCTGRGDAAGKIHMAPCGTSPLHQRSVHAYCDREFRSVERNRSQDACGPQRGREENGYVQGRSNRLAETFARRG